MISGTEWDGCRERQSAQDSAHSVGCPAVVISSSCGHCRCCSPCLNPAATAATATTGRTRFPVAGLAAWRGAHQTQPGFSGVEGSLSRRGAATDAAPTEGHGRHAQGRAQGRLPWTVLSQGKGIRTSVPWRSICEGRPPPLPPSLVPPLPHPPLCHIKKRLSDTMPL